MTPVYVATLGLTIKTTNVGDKKIDGSLLKTYEMATAGFSLQDRLGKTQFFEEPFLLANINIKVVLGILFFLLNNANIQFDVIRFI